MNLTAQQLKNFWSKVIVKGDDDCWLWQAGTDKRGYGLISINNKMYRAPRISILIATGTMPCPELDACHSCDTPGCVNPRHLFQCTRKKNMQDASKRGRVRSWKQKLTHAQVLEIRHREGKHKDIAREFGLDQSTISKIKSKSIWRHI